MPAAGNDILFEALTPIGLTVRVTRNRWLVIVGAKHSVMAGGSSRSEKPWRDPTRCAGVGSTPRCYLFYKADRGSTPRTGTNSPLRPEVAGDL